MSETWTSPMVRRHIADLESQLATAQAARDVAIADLRLVEIQRDAYNEQATELLERAEAAQAERDSWRRVSERLEEEKQQAQARERELREAVEYRIVRMEELAAGYQVVPSGHAKLAAGELRVAAQALRDDLAAAPTPTPPAGDGDAGREEA